MTRTAPFTALSLPWLLAAALTGCGGQSGSSTTATGNSSTVLADTTIVPSSTSTFSSNRGAYSIQKTTTGFTVTDSGGTVSNLSGVDSIKFADMTINLGIGDKSQTIAAADLKTLVELYIAFFNRVPDADGLSYWIDQFKAGQTLSQIADSFYNAAVQFSSLTGYSSTMTNADFVKVIYKNVLGRSTVDDDGLNYWTTSLANGKESRGSLVQTILSSAHTFKGDATFGAVADLLDNKVTVANQFAIQQGLNYNTSEESISKTMAIAAAVTSTSTSSATSLFGSADSGFNLLAAPVSSTPTFSQVQAIIVQRCVPCHSASPTLASSAPLGISFDSEALIRSRASLIYQYAVQSSFMPLGNATQMTTAERTTIGTWFLAGAN